MSTATTIDLPHDIPIHTPGDINSNLNLLKRNLLRIGYSNIINNNNLLHGNLDDICTLYRYVLLSYSNNISNYFIQNNYIINTTNNIRLIETIYKICRNVYHIQPHITIQQYVSDNAYAEYKIIICSMFIYQTYILSKLLTQQKQRRQAINQRRNSTANSIIQRLYTTPMKKSNQQQQQQTNTIQRSTNTSRRPSTTGTHTQSSSIKQRNNVAHRMSQSVSHTALSDNNIIDNNNNNNNTVIYDNVRPHTSYPISSNNNNANTQQLYNNTDTLQQQQYNNYVGDNDHDDDDVVDMSDRINNMTTTTTSDRLAAQVNQNQQHDHTRSSSELTQVITVLSNQLDNVLNRVITTIESIDQRMIHIEQRLHNIEQQQQQEKVQAQAHSHSQAAVPMQSISYSAQHNGVSNDITNHNNNDVTQQLIHTLEQRLLNAHSMLNHIDHNSYINNNNHDQACNKDINTNTIATQ